MKVVISTEVIKDLSELVTVLFNKNYFAFEESALFYVDQIYNFIELDLVNYPHKLTPKNLIKFGSFYAFYKANSNTTWFVFFEKHENIIFIKHITNNHIQDINSLNIIY